MILFAVFAGLYINDNESTPKEVIVHLKDKIQRNLTYLIQDVFIEAKIRPSYFLQPARHSGDGVTINKLKKNDDYILLSSFYTPNLEIRLIKRDGEIIARWPILYSDFFSKNEDTGVTPSTNWHLDIHGMLILPDGSIIFNFEYLGLVKLNKCGEVVWKVARTTHHSVEIAENGGFWVPGSQLLTQGSDTIYPPFKPPFAADTILKISSEGKILKEISVPGLFYKNNLNALLTANMEFKNNEHLWDNEIVHVNKIAELPSELANDFPLFAAGDLVVSLRDRNLLIVVDPEKLEIKWWHIGPWLRQHDPEFKKGGKIVVFNNNIYKTAFSPFSDNTRADIPRISNIIEIDPATNQYEIVYGEKADQKMLSILRGKIELTLNDGMLITEFEGGRAFEVNKEGKIIWQYVNRYDEDEVAEITEARLYPKSYFSVTDWSCPEK